MLMNTNNWYHFAHLTVNENEIMERPLGVIIHE
jgi:hypothetical protein